MLIDEARERVALVEKRDNLHGLMTKESTLQQSLATGIEIYCKDLAKWPRSWMGLPEDLLPEEEMVVYFRPFLEHLVGLGLSRKPCANTWTTCGL